MKIVCACCGDYMGDPTPDEPGTINGICDLCRLETRTPEVRYGQEKIEQIVRKLRDIKTFLHKEIRTRAHPRYFREILCMANDLTKLLSEGETLVEAAPVEDANEVDPRQRS